MEAVVNYKDARGMVPLHRAARVGILDLAQMIVDHRAGPARAPALLKISLAPSLGATRPCYFSIKQSSLL